MFAKMKPSVGTLSVSMLLLVVGMLVVSCQPLQCDDPDGNAAETYGKLQVIPPTGDETVDADPVDGLADEPVKLSPSKTQHDIVKSRNSKFLGVERSSEEQ
uniref:Uncharacterized protein n=1 Tax=Anopheles atroparvus TaxID=41427 RepID=A0A182J1M8_ANOAO